MSRTSEGFPSDGSTDRPGASDWDRVLPFQLDALGVRGRLVRLSTILDEVI